MNAAVALFYFTPAPLLLVILSIQTITSASDENWNLRYRHGR
jgi:hypothetical protein